MICELCPRMCGADRRAGTGFCGEKDEMRIAKIMLHHWEEPCISGPEGGAGSGAVFFSGCSLRCVYCQNKKISRGKTGKIYTPRALADEIAKLCRAGAYNINFVTPTHFTDKIKETLEILDGALTIPVVWNTSGYERSKTVSALSGYADIFLTDLKYFSPERSLRYSFAEDYFEKAISALCEMVKVTGAPRFENGLLKSGVIVRHLVLPGGYKDSINILRAVSDAVGFENVILSLMAQYTPEFLENGYHEIERKITTFEYEKVLSEAQRLGFNGYMQDKDSASSRYTPDF